MITVCFIFRVMSIVMYGLSYWTNRTSKVEDKEEENNPNATILDIRGTTSQLDHSIQ